MATPLKSGAIVVTSISAPNPVLSSLADGARDHGARFIVIGDSKSPADFRLDGCDYYSLAQQQVLPFRYAALCHQRSYTRKNIGYLLAMRENSQFIVETDDDNFPLAGFWRPRDPHIEGDVVEGEGWFNAYRYFSESKIYPRGFPIELLQQEGFHVPRRGGRQKLYCPIQQGLADGNPDVDAIYRMLCDLPLSFSKSDPLILRNKQWCPFNSQNTTIFRAAFALLYLPTFCSFRMTDIWRSFVAQRVTWACGWNIAFHAATVFQERNEHNLLVDFADEIPGYLNNASIRTALDALELRPGDAYLVDNMVTCYAKLAEMELVSPKELPLLDAWFEDLRSMQIL